MNTENYVVHGDAVYLESDWDSDCDYQCYDDVLRCTVNYDHPLFDSETYCDELANYWATGVKPEYVL